MNPLLTFVLSTVGAAIGAWIAASLALRRFKREQAFARRAEWYARMIEALHRLIWAIHKQTHVLESTVPTGVTPPDTRTWNELIDEFALARATADVFAREYARNALDEATAALNDVGTTQVGKETQSAAVRAGLKILEKARSAVAKEARTELFGTSWARKRLNP